MSTFSISKVNSLLFLMLLLAFFYFSLFFVKMYNMYFKAHCAHFAPLSTCFGCVCKEYMKIRILRIKNVTSFFDTKSF